MGKWVKIIDLKLEGHRFEGHALTLDALKELIDYQTLITQTAIEIFRCEYPKWGRLPNNFEERTILRFTKIDDGSAALPLEAYFEDTEQDDFFLPKNHPVLEAVELTGQALESVRDNKPLPEKLPKNVIPLLSSLGSSLQENEKLKLRPANNQRDIEYTHEIRQKILKFSESHYEDKIDIVGMVGAADVVHSTFNLYVNEKKNYSVIFPLEDEETITTALKEHKLKKLRVRGIGEFSADGTLRKINRLDSLEEITEENQLKDSPYILDILLAIAESAPREEVIKLPIDLAINHDKYISQQQTR